MNQSLQDLKHLPVRTLQVACGDEAHGIERSVHCPRHEGAVSLDECAGCAHCSGVPSNPAASDAEVLCHALTDPHRPRDPSLDLREAMLRTTVGELLAGVTVCVHPETDLDVASELLSRPGVKCVPVVDRDARIVGILSEGDLVRESAFDRGCEASVPSALGSGFHVEEPSRRGVADVMTPLVHTLPEDAPLSYAVGLMAGAGLRQVPVVGGEGQVVGMFTAVDALRWIARTIGYVL